MLKISIRINNVTYEPMCNSIWTSFRRVGSGRWSGGGASRHESKIFPTGKAMTSCFPFVSLAERSSHGDLHHLRSLWRACGGARVLQAGSWA